MSPKTYTHNGLTNLPAHGRRSACLVFFGPILPPEASENDTSGMGRAEAGGLSNLFAEDVHEGGAEPFHVPVAQQTRHLVEALRALG